MVWCNFWRDNFCGVIWRHWIWITHGIVLMNDSFSVDCFSFTSSLIARIHLITPLTKSVRRGELNSFNLHQCASVRPNTGHLAEDVRRRVPDVCHRDSDPSLGHNRRKSQRGVLPRLARLSGRLERRVPVSGEDRRGGRDHLLWEMRAALLLLQRWRAAGSGQLRERPWGSGTRGRKQGE